MATLNVQDYGATGDGSTDDTSAINDAISDAGQGDTILVPETPDCYLVTTSNRAAVDFTGVADGVTITGEGPNSRIKLGDVTDSKNQWVLGGAGDGPTISGLVVKRLTLDGNRTDNGNQSTAAIGLYPGGGGHDITFEDVICENAAGTGWSNSGVSAVTLRRVTARNNGRHGFDFTADGSSSPDTHATSIKSVDNDGTGMDFHTGSHIVENAYTDNNRNGSKLGATGGSAGSVTIRNANMRNARSNDGWYSSGEGGASVVFDTVQIVGAHKSGIECRHDHDYMLRNEVLIADCNHSHEGDEHGLYVTDSATVDADTVRCQSTNETAGLGQKSSGGVSVTEYYHYRNDGGATVDSGSGALTIGTYHEQLSSALDVLGPNDVGAFTDTSDDEDPATYETDFSAYEPGTTPSDWTPRYASADGDWTIVSDTDPAGGNQLQFDAAQNDRHALSWTDVGTVSDVELLALFRVGDLSQDVTAGGRLLLRGSGTDGSESSYFVEVRDETFGVWKYVSGDADPLSEWGAPQDDQWYLARFRASGDRLQARIWPPESDEPDAWDVDVSDGDLSSGWIGTGSYSEFTDYWGFLSVGVGGEPAPMPELADGSPGSSAVLPTVSGSLRSIDSSIQTE